MIPKFIIQFMTTYQLITQCLRELKELRELVEEWLGEEESEDGSDVEDLDGDTEEEDGFEEREESRRKQRSTSLRESGPQ